MGCKILVGQIKFNRNMPCTKEQLWGVWKVIGTITFEDMSSADPLECMPNLHIIIDLSNGTEFGPPINIKYTTSDMQRFSFNRSLVIYSAARPLISLPKSYILEIEEYRQLSQRFGSKNIDRGNFKKPRECRFQNNPVMYLNELDDCDYVDGNLNVEGGQPTGTKTKLQSINGCVKITDTQLDLGHIHFLRNLIKITCVDGHAIYKNRNLCVPRGFLYTFAQAHNRLTEHSKSEMMNLLAHNKGKCSSVCTAEDIEHELPDTRCETVYGNLRLRESIMKRIRTLKALHGRLIIDSFLYADPFDHIPDLRLIKIDTIEPVIEITNNEVVRSVSFPDELKIETTSKIIVTSSNNRYYKMNSTMYTKMGKKYGLPRIKAEVLKSDECYFVKPINNLTVLDGCETVNGDLHILGEVVGTTRTLVKIVTGCVIINGTDLTSVPFLKFLDRRSSWKCKPGHVITDNPTLCIGSLLRALKLTRNVTGLDRIVIGGNNHYCPNVCDRDDMINGVQCSILKEGIIFQQKMLPILVPAFVSVQEVQGKIIIKDTNVTEVKMLSSLERMYINDDGAAVEITGNMNLTNVSMSNLMSIKSPSKTSKLIVIRDNGNYTMPWKQYKLLAKRFGESRLDIDHEIIEEEEKVREKHNRNTALVGVVLGIAMAAFLAIAAVIAVLIVQIRRVSKTKKEDKQPLLKNADADQQEQPLNMFGTHSVIGKSMATIMSFIEGKKPNDNSVDNAKTAPLALDYDGDLKNNESRLDDGPKTACTMKLGNGKYAGAAPKDNQSMIRREALEQQSLRSNIEVPKSGVTAATAAIGGNGFVGNPKENVSVMQKEAKENKAMLTEAKQDGPVSAMTANIGGAKSFAGNLKDNASVMQKNKTPQKAEAVSVVSAYISDEKYTGNVKDNPSVYANKRNKASSGGGKNYAPISAMTANIGGKKYSGNVKNNQSVYVQKGMKSSMGNAKNYAPISAVTANIGGKKYSGNAKNNVSVMGKSKMDAGKKESNPVSAITANIGGKKFSGNAKNNASVMQGGVDKNKGKDVRPTQ